MPIHDTTLYNETNTAQITFGKKFCSTQEISIPKYNAYCDTNVVPERHSSLLVGQFLNPMGYVIPCDYSMT